ncbi:MAG: hypothetical protein GF346_03800 [Candidatus Eisenbacteria bacterium]|nr:hypothetical protein [Candidatus Latescibacterota bacterium]MBD3301548.1 hypothetical protein [Candidatus Eisenbacteria bacterium]
MQEQFEDEHPARDFQFLGVNEVGHERGNEAVCEGRAIPWLQETEEEKVWDPWDVTYRDVIFLDQENRPVAVFNLTIHDLSEQAEYDSLLRLVERLTGGGKDDD